MRLLEFVLIIVLVGLLAAFVLHDGEISKAQASIGTADQKACLTEVQDSVKAGIAISKAARVRPHAAEQPLVSNTDIENAL